MKTEILKKDLDIRVSDHAGVVKAYSADCRNIKIEPSHKVEFDNLTYIIRELKRSEQNLSDACELISTLEASLKEFGINSLSKQNWALYSLAVVLYGACFVKGGIRKKTPLEFILNLEGFNLDLHERIMSYRHKLLVHLDEPHDVRDEKLFWEFSCLENRLIPKGPSLSGGKVMMEMGQKNLEWLDHIKFILKYVKSKSKELSEKTNSLLGNIETVD